MDSGYPQRRPAPQRGIRRRGPAFPSEFDDHTATRLALAHALAMLPTRQREVVVLRYLSDLSETDVAQVTGVSNGTVKTHLHHRVACGRPTSSRSVPTGPGSDS